MRRENRKKESLDFKKVLYISASIVAVAIIGFVITFFIYGNNIENNSTNLGKLNTSIVDDYVQNTEETSSAFGKTVNEISNELSNEISNETNEVTKYAVNTSKAEENTISKNNTVTSKKDSTKTNKDVASSTNVIKNEETVKEPKFQYTHKCKSISLPLSGQVY